MREGGSADVCMCSTLGEIKNEQTAIAIGHIVELTRLALLRNP